MMCLLPDKTEDEIQHLLLSSPRVSPRVSPLLVHFDNDCAPTGCFGNTVSCLMTNYGWNLRMLKDKPQCLAHNVVQFSGSPNVPVRVTLVSSTECFEVHVDSTSAQEERHCPDVCSNVFSAVKDVLDMMHYDIDTTQAFQCPCDPSEPHAATLSTSSSTKIPEKIVCTETNDFYDLKDEQRVWIQKENDSRESKLHFCQTHTCNWWGEGYRYTFPYLKVSKV